MWVGVAMSEFFFSVPLDDTRTLCIAPLTDQCVTNSGQDIEDISGYFLFEKRNVGNRTEIEIIAQATSEEGAFRLRKLLAMA